MYRNVWIKYMNIKVTWGKELPARGLLSGERTKEESGNNLLKYFPFIKKNGRGLIHQSISASD